MHQSCMVRKLKSTLSCLRARDTFGSHCGSLLEANFVFRRSELGTRNSKNIQPCIDGYVHVTA